MKSLVSTFLWILLTIPASHAAEPDVDRHVRYQRIVGHPAIRQLLDVYYQRTETSANKPVIVWVHGGAWKFGNKTHSIGSKARACVDAGYLLVAINYRFHPSVNWNDQAADVAAAVKWTTTHIAGYGGDPKRIILMGHSAGAHLAALTGADPSYLKSAKVDPAVIKAVVLLDGAGYDIPSVMKTSRGQHLKLYQNVFGNAPRQLKAASPIHHFKKNRYCPDYLIIPVASRSITVSQSNQMASVIRKNGGFAKVFVAKDRTHSTLNKQIGTADDIPTAAIFGFLKKRLSKK